MDVIGLLNGNPYMSAVSMIFMNLGSRYITLDISKAQENLLKNPLVRRFTVFCILYVATRDIMMSLILLGVFMFVMGHLLHEDSPLSLLPINVRESAEVSRDEYAKAQEVIAMYDMNRRQELGEPDKKKVVDTPISQDGVYMPRIVSPPQKSDDTLLSQREPFLAYANENV